MARSCWRGRPGVETQAGRVRGARREAAMSLTMSLGSESGEESGGQAEASMLASTRVVHALGQCVFVLFVLVRCMPRAAQRPHPRPVQF